MPVTTQPSMRRARRIDIWKDQVLHIDTMFQDSGTLPGGGRAAVHEYTLTLRVDPQDLRILSLVATPRVLPYPDCPDAANNLQRLLGMPLPGLRSSVHGQLPGTLGCTHLTDALRALADVPALAVLLQTHGSTFF